MSEEALIRALQEALSEALDFVIKITGASLQILGVTRAAGDGTGDWQANDQVP